MSRSRIQNYQNHVRWCWALGGIWDALISQRPEEARARCGLLMAAADQTSIDGKLDHVSSFPPGASSPIPSLQHAQCPSSRRAPAFCPLRCEVGRDFPEPLEGDGLVRGYQEEAGRKRSRKVREGQRGGASHLSKEEGGQREGEEREKWSNPRGRLLEDSRILRGGAKAGATPLDATSRPNSKLLPGATASTFTGAGTIESLMRCLFKSRCRLSSFARSFATQRFEGPDDDLTTSASLFPMPIPYPEVFLKKGERTVGADSRKKFVVLAVIVLNFLHHNRPRSVEKLLKRGQRLRRKQWEIVRIIERQAAAWFEVSPIGAEEMGRAAQKVEGLEGILSKLERSAFSITSDEQLPPEQE